MAHADETTVEFDDEAGEVVEEETEPRGFHERLDEVLATSNVAELLDDDELRKLASRVVEIYDNDEASREEWMKSRKEAMELAQQIRKAKTFPHEGAANMKYPLLTTVAVQFAARASSAVLQGDSLVKVKSYGSDPEGLKKRRADRVSRHMSYQVSEQIEEWEPGHDRLLHLLPIVDTIHKEMAFDPNLQRNVVEVLTPEELVINYHAHPDREPQFATKRVFLTSNDVVERMQSGIYIEDEKVKKAMLGLPEDEQHAAEVEQAKENHDMSAPDLFLEQHGWFDLDGDGYEEPYIITVHYESMTILRINKRFTGDSIMVNEEGEVKKIHGFWHFQKYDFMPSLDGSYYGTGYGSIISPINEALNTLYNQLLDAGTLANVKGGFIARGANMKAGPMRFKLGEWKPLDVRGMSLRDALYPLPVSEPSNVLFNLAMKLLDAGKELGSVTEVMMGQNPGANTPATTTLALIEQGSQVYSNILKRVYRSMKQEFKKLYILNAIYMNPEEYFTFHDSVERIGREDYMQGDMDISPQADPTVSGQQQRLAQAEALLQTLQYQPVDERGMKILKYYYKAIAPDLAEELMSEQAMQQMLQQAQVQMQQAQATQQAEEQKKQAAEQMRQIEAQVKAQEVQLKQRELERKEREAMSDIEKERAEVAKLFAEVEKIRQEIMSMRGEDMRDSKRLEEDIKDGNTRRLSDLEESSGNAGGSSQPGEGTGGAPDKPVERTDFTS